MVHDYLVDIIFYVTWYPVGADDSIIIPMSNESQVLLLILGTALCLGGWFQWPKEATDFLRPRIVVPAIIFYSVFYQFIRFHWLGGNGGTNIAGIARYRWEFAGDALEYVTACLAMFWVGYILPAGIKICTSLENLSGGALISETTLRKWAVGLALLSLAGGLFFDGLGLFNSLWGYGYMKAVNIHTIGIIITVYRLYGLLGIAGALILGYTWPPPGKRPASWPLTVAFLLFCDAAPWMAHFSRGASVFPLLAVIGYVLRYRRIPWATAAASLFIFLLGVLTALTGRGIFGHNGGAIPYISYAWPSFFNLKNLLNATTGTADSFTPLTVVMAGLHDGNNMGRLTKLNWILFQLPLPQFMRPKWTFFPAIFIAHEWNANVASFGYNPGMFGDTFAHWGYGGAFIFILVGIVYRMVDRLAFSPKTRGQLSLLPLLAPASYFALLMGCFTNFRAFNTSMILPFFAVFAYAYFYQRRPEPFPIDV